MTDSPHTGEKGVPHFGTCEACNERIPTAADAYFEPSSGGYLCGPCLTAMSTVSPIRRATAEFNVARWLRGEGPIRERPSYEDLGIAGYSVVATEDLNYLRSSFGSGAQEATDGR